MKKQLLLYLFILSLLMNVFTYMYFSKKEASGKQSEIVSGKKYQDSIVLLKDKLYDADYFSLEKNERAQNFLDSIDYRDMIPKVKDALMEYNTAKEGNAYVDMPPMDGKPFIVNKIKVLNHRWIIADYSNGELWGEVLIQYFIKPDGTYSFDTMKTYLYPKEIISQ